VKIQVKTPARLHMGLIDLNGDLGRMFGGLGLGIDKPNVVLEASKTKGLSVTGEKSDLARLLAIKFFDAYHLEPNAKLKIKQMIPEHTGLGSGTQLALAVGTALSRLKGIETTAEELSLVLGRGKRTGVGTAIFAQGGFVVDGGKKTKHRVSELSPLILRREFPEDWRFVVAIPNTFLGLSNHEETKAFENLEPMPAEKVGKICRLIIMKLLPALVEKEIEAFGEALTQIQVAIGENFSSVQGGRYSNSLVTDGIEYMLKQGAYGVGQSSWGPAFYGLARNQEEAERIQQKMRAFLGKDKNGEVFIAKANNRGAKVTTS
jgi:beta-ribofuranosylaminobenzene 5'-phosphate synthase